MAVTQAEFDSALGNFLADIDTGMQAIADKLAALAAAGTPVDLSAELQQIADGQAKFDAAVAADTAPPAVAEPAPAEAEAPPAA